MCPLEVLLSVIHSEAIIVIGFFQGRRLHSQGITRYQDAREGSFGNLGQPTPVGGYPTSGFPNVGNQGFFQGRGGRAPTAMSAMSRDECFDFRSGNCRRGASCRYRHTVQLCL